MACRHAVDALLQGLGWLFLGYNSLSVQNFLLAEAFFPQVDRTHRQRCHVPSIELPLESENLKGNSTGPGISDLRLPRRKSTVTAQNANLENSLVFVKMLAPFHYTEHRRAWYVLSY